MIVSVFAPAVLLVALTIDALLGDPDWLWRRAPHPVVLIGQVITRFERTWNGPQLNASAKIRNGCLLVVVLLGLAGLAAAAVWGLDNLLAGGWPVLELILVATLLAQRSLYEHVARVRDGFAAGGLDGARRAVAMVVGRDPQTLDAAGVSRAAVESTAENFSDGVVAPVFWYLVAGLPGLLIYKAINTADSMVGHRNERYREFGWAAARLDDGLNLVPARVAGGLIAAAAGPLTGRSGLALSTMLADADKHRSPNAGWPEAAMAGALDLALAGPRIYSGALTDDPWLNVEGRRAANVCDIAQALGVLRAACVLQGVLIAGLTLAVQIGWVGLL